MIFQTQSIPPKHPGSLVTRGVRRALDITGIEGLDDYAYASGDFSYYGEGSGGGGVYGGDTNYPDLPSYDTGSGGNGEVLGPIYQADTTPTFSSDVTSTSIPNTNSGGGGGSSESTSYDFSSFWNNILGGASSTPTYSGSPAVSTPNYSTSSAKKPLSQSTPPKPAKKNNKPDVDAYELLLKNNLSAYLASTMTANDKVVGENYFTQVWTMFSQEMAGAGSWGTTGIKDRSRGGKYDWWVKYYDPISLSSTSGTVASSLSSVLGSTNSLILYAVLGFAAVWAIQNFTMED